MQTLQTIHPEFLSLNADQISVLMPYFIVFGGAVLAMLAAVMKLIQPKWPVFFLTLAAAVAAIASSLSTMGHEPLSLFNGMMVADRFSGFFNVIFMCSAGLTALASFRYLDREKLQLPEYYILLLFSALGMMLMTSAIDLIVIFIALEIMSLSVYTLVGFRRADRRSNEAGMKYFILGSAASAILLYGSGAVVRNDG